MEQAAKLESSLGGGPAEEHDEVYVCLWAGCKVHGKTSCSKSWLEKHVPTHGGKFNFACMVGGCKQRFTSQVREEERDNPNLTWVQMLSAPSCCVDPNNVP